MDDDRLDLTPERELARRVEREAMTHQGVGGFGYQDRPGGRRRQEACRRVHRVAGDRVGIAGGAAEIAGHDGARVNPHVQRDGLPQTPRPCLVQRGAAIEHVQRGVAGPGRIVLVSDGCAEDRQGGVPHELLHEAVIAGNRPGQHLEQGVLKRADLLGIESLGERGEPGEIGEEDGHLSAVPAAIGDSCRRHGRRWCRRRHRAAGTRGLGVSASGTEREVGLAGEATRLAGARQRASAARAEGKAR